MLVIISRSFLGADGGFLPLQDFVKIDRNNVAEMFPDQGPSSTAEIAASMISSIDNGSDPLT